MTNMSYRSLDVFNVAINSNREIQSLLLIPSLFAPDVNLVRMICWKYVIRKASQEVMWDV